MRPELLAKDNGSGEHGCPSVHIDHDSSAELLVQGDGVVHVGGDPFHRTVRIDATIVARALLDVGLDVPGCADDYIGSELLVSGPEEDISRFPDPLPGERVVRADCWQLVAGLVRCRTDRLAETADLTGRIR